MNIFLGDTVCKVVNLTKTARYIWGKCVKFMDSGQNWLYTTFRNILLLPGISADPADLSKK